MMNNINKKSNSEDKILYILTGAIVNTGILFLPNSLSYYAKQDSWISAIIGLLYPLYMVFCASYLKKNYPNEDILMLSNKYLGKYLGGICNFFFMFTFIVFLSSIATVMSNFIKTYSSINISNIQFILIFLIVGAYAASFGMNVIVKMSQFVFFASIPILIPMLNVLKYGDMLNVMPVIGSGFANILRGSMQSMYAYGGIELILIIYIDYNDEKKIRKYGVFTVIYVAAIYGVITFLATFYWGTNVLQKTVWASVYLVESIRSPVINSLRFLLLFFWIIVTLKAVSIYYYICNRGLNYILRKHKSKQYYIYIYILCIIISLNYKNELMRRMIINKIYLYFVFFNLFFTTLIVIFVFLKKEGNYEK